ncbi:MAG: SPOR domain-containing protein [Parvularculaceae bacterium]
MTAEPKKENIEEDLEDYDEFDEEENERGLSGLVVLLMGVVMLGAFASVVWIAYQQGIRSGSQVAQAPTIVADPDPVKIENTVPDTVTAGNEQSVYDKLDGTPEAPEVIAEAAEEPLDRGAGTAAVLESAETPTDPVVDDAVADRIANLAAADKALEAQEAPEIAPPEPAAISTPTPPPAAGSAGTHVVQVGAFKSQAEAESQWAVLQRRLGDFANGKANDIERADLGAKGVFYRLRIVPFGSKADAQTYCEGLKSRGADCMVKAS